MRKSRNVLFLCIAALIVSGVLNVWLIQDCWLEEPVIFQSYITTQPPELRIYEGDEFYDEEELWREQQKDYFDINFTINYLTNKNEPIEAVVLTFEELPDISFYISENNPNGGWTFYTNGQQDMEQGQTIGRYAIRTVYVTLDGRQVEKIAQMGQSLELSNAAIGFIREGESQSELQKVDIGKIVIPKEQPHEEERELMNSMSVGSDSSGKCFQEFTVNEDLRLVGMESYMQSDATEIFDIKINDKLYEEALGMVLTKDTGCRVETKLKKAEQGSGQYVNYQGILELLVEDSRGQVHRVNLSGISYELGGYDLKFWDLRNWLKEKGEI